MDKVCSRCGETKSVDEFWKDSRSSDGLRSACIVCLKKSRDNDRYRRANRDRATKARSEGRWNTAWRTTKEWHARHREQQRRYRARNRNQYRKRNSVRMKVFRSNQRSENGSITVQEWQDLCERYGNVCLSCGTPAAETPEGRLTIDHVKPVSEGGLGDIENLQPLCMSCNRNKGTRTVDYRP